MKLLLSLLLCIQVIVPTVYSQNIPDGYILQYTQNFNNNKGLADFNISDRWIVARYQKNFYLQCKSGSQPDSLSDIHQMAILKKRIFGDFILEAEVMPVVREGVSQDISLILGMKDSTKYYFVWLSTNPANKMQGIYLVKKSITTRLSPELSSYRPLLANTWQKIRIERNIVRRTIRIFEGDMDLPLMEIKDYELVMGSIGFGTTNGPACFDNLSIWAPTMIEE